MPAAPAPEQTPAPGVPGLHGTSASGAMQGLALLFGAIVAASWSSAAGGHLPWPALDWAVTTAAGTLLLTTLSLLLVGPPYMLYTLWQLRRDVARAFDVTGLPPVLWPTSWSAHLAPPPRSARLRWLGEGRHDHVRSLALLVLGVLLASVLAGAFLASTVYGLAGLGREQVACARAGAGCPPPYPITGSAVASLFAAIALAYGVRARWLRRVAARARCPR